MLKKIMVGEGNNFRFYILSNACSISAIISFESSIPIDKRIKSGVTPVDNCSSSVNCECVVLAGCIANVFASPIFASNEANSRLLTNFLPASSPPSIPNPIIAP